MRTNKTHKKNHLSTNSDGQMITLMGITLALSIFIIASIPSQLSDVQAPVPKAQSTSIISEFSHIKEIFGLAVNYDIVNMTITQNSGNITFYPKNGKFTVKHDVTNAARNAGKSLYRIELQYDRVFNLSPSNNGANLFDKIYFSHISQEGHVYHVDIPFSFKDENTVLFQTVRYSILCNERYH